MLLNVLVVAVAIWHAQAVEFRVRNNEIGPIWLGILGNAGKPPLANGGVVIGAGEQVSYKTFRDTFTS